MARRRFALRRRHAPRLYARRVGHLAKRGTSAAARAAQAEKHTIAAAATAFGFGFLGSQSASLPFIPALGLPGTYGVVLWAAARFMKNRTLSHMATGLLAVGASQLGAQLGAKHKIAGELLGDEDELGADDIEM